MILDLLINSKPSMLSGFLYSEFIYSGLENKRSILKKTGFFSCAKVTQTKQQNIIKTDITSQKQCYPFLSGFVAGDMSSVLAVLWLLLPS